MTRQTEIAEEQRHVDRVYARLATLREEAERTHREGYRLARARTPGSLVERDAMVYHAAMRLRALDSEYEGLVFGRLDLTDREVRHIGRLGLRDTDYEPLVIDWRAPGAAAFYQATAEEPMGVVRRRVIRCSGPKVLDVEDDLLDVDAAKSRRHADVKVVGDGALIAALARARGRRMRDIVATIQREQDEAIRAPASGVTLIEGGPGTGKTAVALHRAAHLLYRDRRRFEGGGILLVGPSPIFMSYVERVLPSLGEDTVELRAMGEVVDGVTSDRLDPPALAALKGSVRMRRLLMRAVREGPPGAPARTSRRVTRARCCGCGVPSSRGYGGSCTAASTTPTRPGGRSGGRSWRRCGGLGPRTCPGAGPGPVARRRGLPKRSPTGTSSSGSSTRGGRRLVRPRCWVARRRRPCTAGRAGLAGGGGLRSAGLVLVGCAGGPFRRRRRPRGRAAHPARRAAPAVAAAQPEPWHRLRG